MNDLDWARVGQAVRDRRMALDLTQKQAATAAEVSDTTWLSLETGRAVSARTSRRATKALRWSPDSIDRLLRGEEPVDLIPLRDAYDRAVERYQDAGYAGPGTVLNPEKAAALAEVERTLDALHEAGELGVRSPRYERPPGEQTSLLPEVDSTATTKRAGDPLELILQSLDEMRSMLRELLGRDDAGGGRSTR